MLKRLVLSVIALTAIVLVIPVGPAQGAVSWGFGVGPVYPAYPPYTYSDPYAYPYDPYAYPDPYYEPGYVYPPAYVAPVYPYTYGYYGFGRDRDRHYRGFERRGFERQGFENRGREFRGGHQGFRGNGRGHR